MSGIVAQGTVLAVGDGNSPISYTTIGHVVGISGPNSDRDEIDVSTMGSTAKEFQLGFIDGGEVSFELNHKPGDSGQAAVKTLFETDPPPLRSFRITLPTDTDAGHSTGTTIVFNGRVKSMPWDIQQQAPVRNSGVIRVTGLPTVTYGS